MSTVAALRRVTAQSINRNPVDLELTRPIMTDSRGAKRKTGEQTRYVTVRMYRLREPEATVAEPGEKEVRQYGLLARYDADIAENDEFTRDGVKYKVGPIDVRRYDGEIVALHCEVARMR